MSVERFLAWPRAIDREIKNSRYAWLIRPCITRETRASSLVVDSGPCYHPLQLKWIGSFSSIQMFHTHTHRQAGIFSEECEAEQNVRNKSGCGSLYTYGSGGSAQFSKGERKVKKSVLR